MSEAATIDEDKKLPVFALVMESRQNEVEIMEGKLEKYSGGITEAEQLPVFTEILAQAKGMKKQIEEQRMDLTKPYRDLISTTNDAVKNRFTKPLDAVISKFSGHILEWDRKVTEEAEQAQAAIQEQFPNAAVSVNVPATTKGVMGSSTSFIKDWDIEIEALSKVPSRYVSLDIGKVKKDIRDGKLKLIDGVPQVRGLKITSKKRLSSRTQK